MELVHVDLADRSYNICIGGHITKALTNFLTEFFSGSKVPVVTNETIWNIYGDKFTKEFELENIRFFPIILPDGEQYKKLSTIQTIYDKLIEKRVDRFSPLVALGGGVIGDMGGFAAATYLRGIPYIQVPTTLLSQVDSSVGGKTGVNHEKGKNLIGAFYQPQLVVIDIEILATLPEREFLCGVAEIVKYGIIADRSFFEYLEENMEKLLQRDQDTLSYCIRRSCEIKSDIVSQDERESGRRAILNYGHTFGHAVEAVTNYTEFRHGEAVALGMIMAAHVSHSLELCSESETERISFLAGKVIQKNSAVQLRPDSLVAAMSTDKKVKSGKKHFVLNCGIGTVTIRSDISDDILLSEIKAAIVN